MHALVDAGADLRAEDDEGFTALLNAVKVRLCSASSPARNRQATRLCITLAIDVVHAAARQSSLCVVFLCINVCRPPLAQSTFGTYCSSKPAVLF